MLTALIPYFTGRAQTKMLGEALTVAREIDHHGSREADLEDLKALMELRPRFRRRTQTIVVEEALAAAEAIEDEGNRAAALAELLPRFRGRVQTTLVGKALMAVGAAENGEARVKVLRALVPYLHGEQMGKAVEVARVFKHEGYRAAALLCLPLDENDKDRVREIRSYQIAYLEKQLLRGVREELFGMIFRRDVVVLARIWGHETIVALARHIIEIGQRRWL